VTRESIASKGTRYLTEARLTVQYVSGDTVRATCRGSGDVYRCGHDPRRGWYCSCPATRDCAHLYALQSVTVRRAEATEISGKASRIPPDLIRGEEWACPQTVGSEP